MKVYHSISDFQNVSRPILTTGTFDGVHFGHKIIIDRLKEIAKNQNGETVLLTFSPHPRMVLFPDDHNLQLINTLDEKIKLFGILFGTEREHARLDQLSNVSKPKHLLKGPPRKKKHSDCAGSRTPDQKSWTNVESDVLTTTPHNNLFISLS